MTVDEDGRTTSRPGVFAAGDAVNRARTAVEAAANGKRVAEAVHAHMQILPRPHGCLPVGRSSAETETSKLTVAERER